MKHTNAKEIIGVCHDQNLSLSAFARMDESEKTERTPDEIDAYLHEVLSVMFAAVDAGLNGDDSRFKAKIIRRDSIRLKKRFEHEKTVLRQDHCHLPQVTPLAPWKSTLRWAKLSLLQQQVPVVYCPLSC